MHVSGVLYVHEQNNNRIRASYRHTKPDGHGGRDVAGYSDYTVWLVGKANGERFERGDLIEIDGAQQIRKGEYEGRPTFSVSINAWKAKKYTPTKGEPPADAPPVGMPPEGQYDEEVPF